MNDKEAEAFSRDLLNRLENSTPEHLGEMFGPGGIVWHNSDYIDMTWEDDLTMLPGMRAAILNQKFNYVYSAGTTDGCVLMFVMTGTRITGEEMQMHNCCVVRMKDGKIQRIDEYVDPNAVAGMQAAGLQP